MFLIKTAPFACFSLRPKVRCTAEKRHGVKTVINWEEKKNRINFVTFYSREILLQTFQVVFLTFNHWQFSNDFLFFFLAVWRDYCSILRITSYSRRKEEAKGKFITKIGAMRQEAVRFPAGD
jgi:hypothetical protein